MDIYITFSWIHSNIGCLLDFEDEPSCIEITKINKYADTIIGRINFIDFIVDTIVNLFVFLFKLSVI